jgi:hypothetical protein
MEGVTLLHEFAAGGPSIVGIVICGIFALGFLALAVWGIIMKWRYHNNVWKWKEVIACLVATLIFLGGVAWSVSLDTETHFKVTIDENVPYVQFTEIFDVIDQEGAIYTVRYKDGGTEWIDNTKWFEDAVG